MVVVVFYPLPQPLLVEEESDLPACGSPSSWPAVPSLRRGLSTTQGWKRGVYVGAVQEMMCVACVGVTEKTQWWWCDLGATSEVSLQICSCVVEVFAVFCYCLFFVRCIETIDACIWRMFVFMSVVVTVWASVGIVVV